MHTLLKSKGAVGAAIACLIFSMQVEAAQITLSEQGDSITKHSRVVPYAFYNASFGPAVAATAIAAGYGQDQLSFVANAFASPNDTRVGLLFMKDLQLSDRLFVDGMVMMGQWGEVDTYVDGNPNYDSERAGSHGSSKGNHITSSSEDAYYRLNFKYQLPIGHGADSPVHRYRVDSLGQLLPGYASGGDTWNPLTSGLTSLETEFFYRDMTVAAFDGGKSQMKTLGLTAALVYDNRDFIPNPSRGSHWRAAVSRDWGAFESDGTGTQWTTVEVEASKYLDLGATDHHRQRVLALNTWWVDTPSWNDSSQVNGERIYHRPPSYAGATLGGINRLKGYASNRFHDRSAVYYSAEYRATPHTNPFTNMPLVNNFYIPWWQWVAQVEAGRVHDQWDVGTLHEDMNWSASAGIRVMVEGLLLRLDTAYSEEGGQVQMFIGHSF